MKAVVRRAVSVIIIVVLFFLAYIKIGFFFETNDDRIINEILSGAITGSPDGHAVFLNPLLSETFAFLYRVTDMIPWYGLFLITTQAVCHMLVLSGMYRLCNRWYKYLVATAIQGGAFLINLYFIGNLEFTSAAAMVAVFGYVVVLLYDRGKQGTTGFIILEALAFCIRRDAMLMIQPIGFCVLAGFWLWRDGRLQRQRLKQLFFYGAVLIVLFGLGSLIAAPKTAEWKEYSRFNTARATLYDYYGTPEYEEVAEILSKYEVTKAEYSAYRIGTIGGKINTECLSDLIAYMKQRNAEEDTAETFRESVESFYHANYWGLQTLTFSAWLVGIVWALVRRRFYILWSLLGLRLSCMVVRGYLIWKGRLPMRIVLPLFACEFLLTVTVCFREWFAEEAGAKWEDIAVCILCLVLVRGCLATGYDIYRFVRMENEGQKVYMQGMREIQQYCQENGSNKYLLDALSMSYYRGEALDTEIYRRRNNAVTGSWYSNSPSMNSYLEEYFADCEGTIYLIVSGDIDLTPYPTVAYLAEILQTEPLESDRFVVSNGGEYIVYQYRFVEYR
ncbi:MAG: hypothetical protein ACI4AB_03790 [Acetatifactor sp.]